MNTALPVTDDGPMMERVKNKEYQKHPIGAQAARYLDALRYADASEHTCEAYETVYDKLARDFPHYAGIQEFDGVVGTELLEDFLHRHYGHRAPATRAVRLAALRGLLDWGVQVGLLEENVAKRIRGPRAKNKERQAYPRPTILALVSAQESRDVCCLWLLSRLALRKEDLRLLQIRDIDTIRNLVILRHGKGGKQAVLPIQYRQVQEDLMLHILGERREPAEYLLYPRGERTRPMSRAAVHRWFKRCLIKASLPSTVTMHELRHTAGDELWRATGNIVLAQKLLRHESVGTTQAYLHPTQEDLVAGMRVVEEQWESR